MKISYIKIYLTFAKKKFGIKIKKTYVVQTKEDLTL